MFYEKACGMHVEGIVSKRIDAPYAPGNRGLWRKVKCLNRAEFVVAGWTDPEGRRPYLGALRHRTLVITPDGWKCHPSRPSSDQRRLSGKDDQQRPSHPHRVAQM